MILKLLLVILKNKARQEARKASGMSAQKFFVQTRMAEAAKSGKKLDRKALRQKFQSGDVARKGFGAPKAKAKTKKAPYLDAGSRNPQKPGTKYPSGGSAKDSMPPKRKAPTSLADPIGKPKATTSKSVTGPRTKIGAKSFTSRYTKPTSRQKVMKAYPRGGY